MLKITRLPEDMQEFFAVAADGLSVCQKAHLVVYIIGLLLGLGRGNVAALSRLRTDGRHRTTLSHFLAHSPWDGLSVVQRVTIWQIEQLRKQPGDQSDPDRDTIFPTIDDTKQEKPGKKMLNLSKPSWDHAAAFSNPRSAPSQRRPLVRASRRASTPTSRRMWS